MPEYIKRELEKYRKAAIHYWKTVGDNSNAEELKKLSYEDLQIQTIVMARIQLECDTREWEEETRKNEQK